jgi:hypothetical protein
VQWDAGTDAVRGCRFEFYRVHFMFLGSELLLLLFFLLDVAGMRRRSNLVRKEGDACTDQASNNDAPPSAAFSPTSS